MITYRTQGKIQRFGQVLNSSKKLTSEEKVLNTSPNTDITGEIKNGYVKVYFRGKKVYQQRGRKNFNSSELISCLTKEHDKYIKKVLEKQKQFK